MMSADNLTGDVVKFSGFMSAYSRETDADSTKGKNNKKKKKNKGLC